MAGNEKGNKAFTPPSLASLTPLFPQLELLEILGHGGMGAVYKAKQKELDRAVALKILPPGIGTDPAFAERFAREAKALARLNHPGIVTIHDFGRVDGLYYFLMEFVDGVPLQRLLEQSRVSLGRRWRSCPRFAMRCNMPMTKGSSIEISSRKISCWIDAAG